MKVLLDENLPHALRQELPGHDVFTVTYMRWSGKKNGELLALAASQGFDVVLTMDSGIRYQQNVGKLPVTVIVLAAPSNDIDDLRPLLPTLLATLTNLPGDKLIRISQ
jgi:hypothetical protein